MLKPYTVKLYNLTGYKDEHGNWIESINSIKDIDCDIQPYSTELLLKSYGYNIACNKRIFCDFDKDIKIGSLFKYIDKLGNINNYEVVKIINWDDVSMEVAALEVV